MTGAPPPAPTGFGVVVETDLGAVLDERARLLAQRVVRRDAVGEPYLLAAASGTALALPVDRARSVVPVGPLSRLPHCGPGILGVVAVRGAVVPVADLAALIGGGAPATASGGQLVLIDDGASLLGLRVDRVDGLARLGWGGPASGGAEPTTSSGIVAGVTPDGVAIVDVNALLADPRLWPPIGAAGDVAPEPDGGIAR